MFQNIYTIAFYSLYNISILFTCTQSSFTEITHFSHYWIVQSGQNLKQREDWICICNTILYQCVQLFCYKGNGMRMDGTSSRPANGWALLLYLLISRRKSYITDSVQYTNTTNCRCWELQILGFTAYPSNR